MPAILVVNSERETEAQKALSGVQANTTGDINVFANSVDLLVETRLDDVTNNPFYFFADPADLPCIEYCYLEGQENPYMETRNGFDVDGIEMKIRHDFAAAFVDFRGTNKGTGTAS